MLRSLLLACLFGNIVKAQQLVLIGGGLTDGNTDVWNKVVELAGGRGVAKIGIFTTASADPADSATYYLDMFVNTYGAASAVHIPVTETSNNANDQEIADLIRQQTGFFFGGGDQLRVTKALKNLDGSDTLALLTLKQVFQDGAVVGGTSAGTACMGSTFMITSGRPYDSLVYGSYSGGPDPVYPDDLTYDENGGLGLLNGYIPDTHFSERGREARLIRLLQDTKNAVGGVTKGFGVDEDTALVIYNVGSNEEIGEVIGASGGVFFVDVSRLVSLPSETVDYSDIVTTFLTSGDTINLQTGEVTFAPWKTPLKGDEYYDNALSSKDILSSMVDAEWRYIAKRLFDNTFDDSVLSTSRERNPVQFTVKMDRINGNAYGGYLTDGTFIVSYTDLFVAIYESAFSRASRTEKIIKHVHKKN
ncbi:hypothetical protein QYM36_008974 [Artemia franciscana]|uniref:Cyanophycinase n=1 Tax=Artemia franciscana TaxID=6661 RepID=A0AA88L6E1_ARTSF|nr:hypothetical protein QYM36_008974 [Artemia franciscana]